MADEQLDLPPDSGRVDRFLATSVAAGTMGVVFYAVAAALDSALGGWALVAGIAISFSVSMVVGAWMTRVRERRPAAVRGLFVALAGGAVVHVIVGATIDTGSADWQAIGWMVAWFAGLSVAAEGARRHEIARIIAALTVMPYISAAALFLLAFGGPLVLLAAPLVGLVVVGADALADLAAWATGARRRSTSGS